MSLRIRRAGAADAACLTAVAHAAKQHWGYPDELLRLWERELTVTSSDIEADLVFCAEVDGEIAGFYSISGDGESREVEHMWVKPDHIGTGLGRALFEHMMARLGELGVRRLEIASDPNAEGFYLRMGATRVGSIAATPAGRSLPLLEMAIGG